MTDLEYKLLVAGASSATVERAKLTRADAATTLAERAGLNDANDYALERLRALPRRASVGDLPSRCFG